MAGASAAGGQGYRQGASPADPGLERYSRGSIGGTVHRVRGGDRTPAGSMARAVTDAGTTRQRGGHPSQASVLGHDRLHL